MTRRGEKTPVASEPAQRGAQLERDLSAIYRDEEGKMPDLTKLDQQRSRWGVAMVATIAGCAAVLIAAAWFGYMVFHPLGAAAPQALILAVEGPERVSLGEEQTYFVNYQNVAPGPLDHAQLRVTFPSDFTMTGAEPSQDTGGKIWTVGALPVDGRGTIKVRGIFMGALGTVTAIQVVGTYDRRSGSGVSDALATKTLRYDQSVFEGRLEVPASVMPGDRVALVYHVRNNGQNPIVGMVARFTLPDGFQLEPATSTVADKNSALIPIGSLAGGASGTVAVYGTFVSGASGEMHVIAEAGRVGRDQVFLANEREEQSFTVFAGDLSLKMVMNGSDGDAVVSYGDRLRFSVQYENTASEELGGVSLQFRIESPSGTGAASPAVVDWSTYADSASGTHLGNVVTWNQKHIPLLAKLPSHELGTIDIDLHALSLAAATGTQVARVVVEATVGAVGKTKVNRIIKSTPITISYLTDAAFTSEARYYSEEGAPIGKGPLPPIVKETTTYRIHWEIAKHVHALDNVKVTAQLPPIASWTGNTIASAGGVSYDSGTGIITWTVPHLAANEDNATADFDLDITPTDADADRFARVLGESRFEATDANVSKVVTQTQSALSTDLQSDETARGKGVVRKP